MGLIPMGIVHAVPLFALVAAFATVHAAATGRVGEYTAALGVLAVTTAQGGAWALFALASLVALMRLVDYHPPIPGLDRRQLAGVALIPALAAVLPMALRGETFRRRHHRWCCPVLALRKPNCAPRSHEELQRVVVSRPDLALRSQNVTACHRQ